MANREKWSLANKKTSDFIIIFPNSINDFISAKAELELSGGGMPASPRT